MNTGEKEKDNFHIDKRYIVFTIGAAVFHLLFSIAAPLVPQETYYWCYSLRPSAGYFDHPPAVAFFIKAGTLLFGNTALGVRFSAVVSSFLFVIAGWFLVKEAGGSDKAAMYTLAGYLLIPIFAIGGIIITPDVPQALFWMLTILFVLMGVNRNSSGWWYLAGITGGAAMASKYTSALLVPAILLFLLSSPEERRYLRRKEPYIAILLAFLVFLPVVVWNAENHWASFVFQGARPAGLIKKFKPRFFFELLGTQLAALSPVFFFAAWWLIFTGAGKLKSSATKGYRLLYFTFAPIFLFFFAASFRGQVKMNWLIPAYVTMVPFLFIFTNFRRQRKLTGMAYLWAVVVTTTVLIPSVFRTIPLGDADTWSGWDELATRVVRERGEHGVKNLFIFSNSHKTASELTFHLADGTFCKGPDIIGLPGLQYDFWDKPEELIGKDAILAVWELDPLKKSQKKLLNKCFGETTRLPDLKVISGGRLFRTFQLYLCRNYLGPVRN